MDDLVYFYPTGHESHFEPGHPERPERIEAIAKGLQAAGWWQDFPKLPPQAPAIAVLETVHSPHYLSILKAASERGLSLDLDTYTTPASWQLALNAAGGAIAVAAAVWQGNARRGFALTRPPGHHAAHDAGMGFCLINNVAAAAEHLLQKEGAQRLAIVDLDLHHGNGTQDIFWRRVEVLYISTHQSPLYPGSGRLDERGSGIGFGTKANIPLPPGSGDQAFLASMDGLILPLLERYRPEMVLVSFGFDPHWKDPLGSLLLSAGTLAQLIGQLRQYCDQHCRGRIALVLEGGYDLEAAAACSAGAAAALLDRPWKDPLGPAPHKEGMEWKRVIEAARSLWEI